VDQEYEFLFTLLCKEFTQGTYEGTYKQNGLIITDKPVSLQSLRR